MTAWWYWLGFLAVAAFYIRVVWWLFRQSRWSERRLLLDAARHDRIIEDLTWTYLRQTDYMLALQLRAERLTHQRPPLRLIKAVVE